MTIIIGIDPGSRKTGFGIVRAHGDKIDYVSCGLIRVAELDFAERLKCIFESVQLLVAQYEPTVMVVEQVFMGKNASSALKLGQARGAAITAGAVAGLVFSEYSARQIKQAVTGTGAADKEQVQKMVRYILKLNESPQEDAADALACAICHAHSQHSLLKMAGESGHRHKRIIG
jgi:crossover junction endodeoxyribonuclease RuvC